MSREFPQWAASAAVLTLLAWGTPWAWSLSALAWGYVIYHENKIAGLRRASRRKRRPR